MMMRETRFAETYRRPGGDTGRFAHAFNGMRETVGRPWQIGGFAKE